MKKILFWAVIMLFAACGRIIKVSDLQYKEGERAVLYVFYADKACVIRPIPVHFPGAIQSPNEA